MLFLLLLSTTLVAESAASGAVWCEARLIGSGEPQLVNAVTSLTHCYAGYRIRNMHVFLIGIGSFLFHLWPIHLTRLMDEVPIILLERQLLSSLGVFTPAVLSTITVLKILCAILLPSATCVMLLATAWMAAAAAGDRLRVPIGVLRLAVVCSVLWVADFGYCPLISLSGYHITYHSLWHLATAALAVAGIPRVLRPHDG